MANEYKEKCTFKSLGIYIHIPFCISKCAYCGFLSWSIEGKKEYEEIISDYIDALCNELEIYKTALSGIYRIDTIFIGGGTPSLLEPELIGKILERLDWKTADCEITIESNPKTFTSEKLKGYKKSGINRLSIGVQSFSDDILKSLGRLHSAEEALKAYEMARKSGYDNINLDLMFGLVGQDLSIWADTLSTALKLEAEHISFYGLQIEENTPYYEWYKNDKIKIADTVLESKMYYHALDELQKAGYDHYEISNASKDSEHRCRHNLKYWEMKEYVGIGLGASSFLGSYRFKNTTRPDEYIEIFNRRKINNIEVEDCRDTGALDKLMIKLSKELKFDEFTQESVQDLAGEAVFTGLRKIEGFSLKHFREITGYGFWEYYDCISDTIDELLNDGKLVYDGNNDTIKLGKKFILNSNSIMSEFV